MIKISTVKTCKVENIFFESHGKSKFLWRISDSLREEFFVCWRSCMSVNTYMSVKLTGLIHKCTKIEMYVGEVCNILYVGENFSVCWRKYQHTISQIFHNMLFHLILYRFFANIYFSITSFTKIYLDNTLCTYLYSTFFLVARFDMSANWLIKQGYLSSVNFWGFLLRVQ